MDNRILIADDDAITRLMLTTLLREWHYEVVEARDGLQTWDALQKPDAPAICILDWLMPGRDGLDICREARKQFGQRPQYFILLTVKTGRADKLAALRSGADDFLAKPFDYEELQVRLEIGKRTIMLQQALAKRAAEVEDALGKVKTLSGLLPICAKCKKIRDDQGYWNQVEAYVSKHLDVRFSHGFCPECCDALYGDIDEKPEETE